MKFYFLVLFLIHALLSSAQQEVLEIQLNKQQFAPGDTIELSARYSINNQPVPVASLFALFQNDHGYTWQKRWPILNGVSYPAVVIPDSLPAGNYRISFAPWPHFFSLQGNIKEPTGINQVKVTLFTHNAEAFDTLLAVDKFGHFRFDNLLFENEARVFFSDARGRNTEPDIEIETNLDSAFHPLSPLTKFFTVGTTSVSGTLPEITDSLWMKTASLLPAVVVYAASELTEEKLNKKYVHGFFNDLNARTFIPDNDPFAASSMDVIQYLNIRVPGMHLVNGFGGEPIFYWRNEAMQFYVDEMKTPGSMLYTFPMRQIALVKVYPPPFFGNMFGGGGGIAIYLKDGTQPGPGNRHNFTIHGYTPLVSSLSAEPGSF